MPINQQSGVGWLNLPSRIRDGFSPRNDWEGNLFFEPASNQPTKPFPVATCHDPNIRIRRWWTSRGKEGNRLEKSGTFPFITVGY